MLTDPCSSSLSSNERYSFSLASSSSFHRAKEKGKSENISKNGCTPPLIMTDPISDEDEGSIKDASTTTDTSSKERQNFLRLDSDDSSTTNGLSEHFIDLPAGAIMGT